MHYGNAYTLKKMVHVFNLNTFENCPLKVKIRSVSTSFYVLVCSHQLYLFLSLQLSYRGEIFFLG